MPQKRSHNKSRRGCLVCRKRRVKCDEAHPTCANCDRRGDQCLWPEQKQVTTAPYPSPPLSPTHKSLAAHTPPPYSAVFADITNTMLMHHYTTVTCLYGISNKEIIALRQIQTPKLAFRYPFMLSVLISHAALDLSLRHDPVHNPPEHDYLAISRAHMRTAWDKNLAPQTVATVGDSMAFVVRFVMSSLHGLLAPGVLLPGWKPKLLAWIPHCRRMFQDLMASIPALQAKVPLSNVLHAMRIPLSETTIPPHVTLHPSIMSIHLPWGGAPDPEELQDENVASLYLEAVSKLQVAYAISTRNGHEFPGLLAWAVLVDADFIHLMMEKRPRALAILAHAHVLAVQVSQFCLTNCELGADMERIYACLDDNWKSWLSTTLAENPIQLRPITSSKPSPRSSRPSSSQAISRHSGYSSPIQSLVAYPHLPSEQGDDSRSSRSSPPHLSSYSQNPSPADASSSNHIISPSIEQSSQAHTPSQPYPGSIVSESVLLVSPQDYSAQLQYQQSYSQVPQSWPPQGYQP